jgi:hypothetical protein
MTRRLTSYILAVGSTTTEDAGSTCSDHLSQRGCYGCDSRVGNDVVRRPTLHPAKLLARGAERIDHSTPPKLAPHSWIIEIIHHGKGDVGQRVASLAGASVFDIMRAPRGAALVMWKQWQTLMPRRSGEAPI